MTDISGKISIPGAPAAYQNPSRRIRLNGGGVFSIPQGNFLVKLGPQCAIQWFDLYSGLWHIYEAGGQGAPVQLASDGTNYRIINLSSTLAAYSVTNSGSGYSQGTISVTLSGGGGNGAAATAIVGGNLTAVISTAGTGYINPVVTIQNPWEVGQVTNPFAIAAVASVGLTGNGQLSGFTFDFPGAGYPGAPVITITDPAGTGAVIVSAVASPGQVTAIVPTNYGQNYVAPPTVTINANAGGGSSATATALPWLAVSAGVVSNPGQGVTGLPVMMSSLGVVNARPNGESWLVRPAKLVSATITSTGGSIGIGSVTVEDAGGGFQTAPTITIMGQATGTPPSVVGSMGPVQNEVEYWQLG